MQPIAFFKERIGLTIMRGTTTILVTEENYEKLFNLQDEDGEYLFTTPLDK